MKENLFAASRRAFFKSTLTLPVALVVATSLLAQIAFAADAPAPANVPPNGEAKGIGTALTPCFSRLPLGEVKPDGWIREQMLRDLRGGFAGRLDKLAREAGSDIFVTGRNNPNKPNAANVNNDHWWNGETEGNWRAGFIMMAYLTGDQDAIHEAEAYVNHILGGQDADGYMGINSPELRYTAPGELWTQACLFRGLLDDAELTGNQKVLDAVKRAADHTLDVVGPGKISVTWDDTHDLMFSDVMERLFYLTGDPKYRDFALWMYEDYSAKRPNADTSLPSLLSRAAPFNAHAVRVYEIIRVPMWLAWATGREDLGRAWRNAMDKVDRYTFPGGAAVGQEAILNLPPDPTINEFEYCDVKELQFDYESALQKTGSTRFADKTEQIFFNDAQGARLADGTAINYLALENRVRIDGKTPDGTKIQKRNTYSPTHADVAVCCNPNATQIAAWYVSETWMRQGDDTLAGLLYGPCTVSTQLHGVHVNIAEKTDYPFRNTVELAVQPAQAAEFTLLLRDPSWSRGTTVVCNGGQISREGSYWRVSKLWQAGDTVQIQFAPSIQEVPAINGEVALQYGALLFAEVIPSEKKVIRTYPLLRFEDTLLEPLEGAGELLAFPTALRWNSFGFQPREVKDGADMSRPFDAPVVVLEGTMIKTTDASSTPVTLVPLGNANLLRRVTFPIFP